MRERRPAGASLTCAFDGNHCGALPPLLYRFHRVNAPQCGRDAPPGRLYHGNAMETIAGHCRRCCAGSTASMHRNAVETPRRGVSTMGMPCAFDGNHCGALSPLLCRFHRINASQCRRDAPAGRLYHGNAMETIAVHCRRCCTGSIASMHRNAGETPRRGVSPMRIPWKPLRCIAAIAPRRFHRAASMHRNAVETPRRGVSTMGMPWKPLRCIVRTP
jgi:hypothetical protein